MKKLENIYAEYIIKYKFWREYQKRYFRYNKIIVFLQKKYMTTQIKKFFSRSLVISGILMVFVVISQLLIPKIFTIGNYVTVLVNWLVTVLIYIINKKTTNTKIPSSFINTFMATSIAKMFVLLVYMVGYVFLIGKDNIKFLVFMLICYTIFTIFEIYSILKEQKTRK